MEIGTVECKASTENGKSNGTTATQSRFSLSQEIACLFTFQEKRGVKNIQVCQSISQHLQCFGGNREWCDLRQVDRLKEDPTHVDLNRVCSSPSQTADESWLQLLM